MGNLKVGDRVQITNFTHAYVSRRFVPYGTVKQFDAKADLNVLVQMDEQEDGKHFILWFSEMYLKKIEQ